MRVRSGLAAVVCLAGIMPAVAAAQGIGVEAAGMYATLSGDDFTGIDAGMGFDAQLRINVASRFSLGGGFQMTSHGNNVVPDNFKVSAFFAEPRLTFSMPASPLTPFLGARVGRLSSKIESGGTEQTASGWEYGATGGAMFRAGPMLNIVVAVMYAAASFGDIEVNGTSQPNSDTSGSSLILRAGVNLRLGR